MCNEIWVKENKDHMVLGNQGSVLLTLHVHMHQMSNPISPVPWMHLGREETELTTLMFVFVSNLSSTAMMCKANGSKSGHSGWVHEKS